MQRNLNLCRGMTRMRANQGDPRATARCGAKRRTVRDDGPTRRGGRMAEAAPWPALYGMALLAALHGHTALAVTPAATPTEKIVVTASTRNLVGRASTAGEGSITAQEVRLHPAFRPGQLLETIPGLEVTSHAGEGKANQYLLRGLNLDHGTDLATFVDHVPVNMVTHAHGQGYTDLNFLIPETIAGIDFTKGPYFAALGDFAGVGSDHIRLSDTLPAQITASIGTLGDQRLYGGGAYRLTQDDNLIAAAEAVHYNGPWKTAEHFRKYNVLLRYVHGTEDDGETLTAQYYYGKYNSTVDQPARAVAEGLINRFGTLDPTDGGRSERYSLSGHSAHDLGGAWHYDANFYLVRYQFLLRNNFTHFLDFPIEGDQNRQNDLRWIGGADLSLARTDELGIGTSTTTFGLQTRYDDINVSLGHAEHGVQIGLVSADHVDENDTGLYAQNMLRWTPWFRSILGVRADFAEATDDNIAGGISGAPAAQLVEPKASLVFGPWRDTEFYFSAGRGFHSNDVRDGTNTTLGGSAETHFARSPLLVKQDSIEAGVRTAAIRNLLASFSVFLINSDSELTYDGDTGTTSAGPATRRVGFELTTQYRPWRWVELRANFAATHGRAINNPAGPYIADSPSYIGSFGALVDNLGPWYGGLETRVLGPHPLIDSNTERARGYIEVNLDAGYKINDRLKVQLGIFNLFNSHGAASEYYYTSRLADEPLQGVSDHSLHPLEPLSARLSLTAVL